MSTGAFEIRNRISLEKVLSLKIKSIKEIRSLSELSAIWGHSKLPVQANTFFLEHFLYNQKTIWRNQFNQLAISLMALNF